MNKAVLYSIFKSRYIELKKIKDEMEILDHPDLFLIKLTLELNQRLMKMCEK